MATTPLAPVDLTAITPEQRKSLDGILDAVRHFQKTGAITTTALYDVIRENAKGMPNDVLTTCHALVRAEYEKDTTLVLLRSVLSALSVEHYHRLVAVFTELPTHALLAAWEVNDADEMDDPTNLERNPASAYQRVVGDRIIEKLGSPAGYDALDKVITDFPDAEGEELPDRLRRYKAHEIAAYRALLAA